MKKLANFAAYLAAFVVVFVTIMYLTAPTETTQKPVQKTEAVKIVKPIDLATLQGILPPLTGEPS